MGFSCPLRRVYSLSEVHSERLLWEITLRQLHSDLGMCPRNKNWSTFLVIASVAACARAAGYERSAFTCHRMETFGQTPCSAGTPARSSAGRVGRRHRAHAEACLVIAYPPQIK